MNYLKTIYNNIISFILLLFINDHIKKNYDHKIINRKSKKIVYIGHSYHTKTKSSKFFIDYLQKYYDITLLLDYSWDKGEYPDLSFINNDYFAVIFFQNLPSNKVLGEINNDNLVFVPMYDGVRKDYLYWHNKRKLKIISFSKNLYLKLKKWNFETIYLQYFPQPNKLYFGNKNEVFFWQRITDININLISNLFKKNQYHIHIHKAVDPNHKFIVPNKNIEYNYNITYSNWFNTKEEMLNLIKTKSIYIAPRKQEGIGMSFLEAMAMGKLVIAVNKPTMNEYIVNGFNGYLFDLKNPKVIDFTNIREMQKNAYISVQKGYMKWSKDKGKIIDFLQQ
jgi:glycosyltransferase involved in cell wall biosynthesis